MAKYKALLLCERNGILPLGPGYLKAYADADKKLSAKVSVALAYLDDIAAPESALGVRPDLAGFSCCGDLARVFAACAKIKARDKNIRIVLGGPATYAVAAGELLAGSGADYVVRGEGEQAFAELLAYLAAGARGLPGVRGLSFRHKGAIVENPARPEYARLDDLPSPYLNDVFDLKGYTKFFVEGSRGCRFACGYCAESNSSLRYFSAARVAAEVRHILERVPDASGISPTDADFFQDRARAKALMKDLQALSAGRRVSFVLTSNPVNWDDGVMAAFASGRFQASVGIQSINTAALAAANRPAEVNKIKSNMRRFLRLAPGARFSADLICGLPGDDLAGYQRTLDWAISTGGDLELNHLRVIPGTYFAAHKERFGIVCGEAYPYFIVSNATFSAGELAQALLLNERIGFLAGNLSLDRYIASALLYLGRALRGRVRLPFLYVCVELEAYMRRRAAFAPLVAEWSRQDHRSYCAAANLAYRAGLQRLIPAFGRAVLKKHGRSALLPPLARAAAAARGRLLFPATAAERARRCREFLRAATAARRTLLVAWADSAEAHNSPCTDMVLLRDEFTGETYGGREGLAPEPVQAAAAAGYFRELSDNSAAGFDAIILSGVYGGLPAAQRVKALQSLRGLSAARGRLLVLDDLSGPPSPEAAPAALKPAALAAELKAAGWKVAAAPRRLAAGKKVTPVWVCEAEAAENKRGGA
ncbi:MAG TPA: cobalamin-dependent protein [Elusimicrobiales bacterium]|nr:cobalamin-dependent protein [Elusimicrobiales bacterium]